MNSAIDIKNLTKIYGSEKSVDNISMSIKEGEIYGLIGENGAGKTTLIKSIFHLIKPTNGEIYILGNKITNNQNNSFSKIGSIIETPIFYDKLTVAENLRLHCKYMNIGDENNIERLIDKCLYDIQLISAKNKKISQLSLGMKQRLGIIRAIIHSPEILILDEPTNGLDPKAMIEIRNLLHSLNKDKGMTILISSHIVSELSKIVDRVGVIHKGKLVDELQINSGMDLETYFINTIDKGEYNA